MAVSRGYRNLVLAGVLLVVLTSVWGAWTLFVGNEQRVAGRVIEPIKKDEVIVEASRLLPGLEFHSLVSGRVFNGTTPIIIKLSSAENISQVLQVFLDDNTPEAKLLHNETIIPGKSFYSFDFNSTMFEDGLCKYRLFIRLKAKLPRDTKEDFTGWFSILNHPHSISWKQFKNPFSTNLDNPGYYSAVTLYKLGAGELRFPAGAILPGTDLDSGISFSHSRLNLKRGSFPCFEKAGKALNATFFNINFNRPKLILNGHECRRCKILTYRNHTLIAQLYLSGNYMVVEGRSSRLEVSNPTRDLRGFHIGEPVSFRANYTNLAGKPIHGVNAGCKLVFPDKEVPMQYDQTSGIYISQRVFSQKGLFEYSAVCHDLSKASNNNQAFDYVQIV